MFHYPEKTNFNVLRGPSPRVRRSRCEMDHIPSPSAAGKNEYALIACTGNVVTFLKALTIVF